MAEEFDETTPEETTPAEGKFSMLKKSLTDYAESTKVSLEETATKTKALVNDKVVEPVSEYVAPKVEYLKETVEYAKKDVGEKAAAAKEYSVETYESGKTYTVETYESAYEQVLSVVLKLKAALGSRKEAAETVEAEVVEEAAEPEPVAV